MIASSGGELTICADGCEICQTRDRQKTTKPVATRAIAFGRKTNGNRHQPIVATCRRGSLHRRRIQEAPLVPQGVHSTVQFKRRVRSQVPFEKLGVGPPPANHLGQPVPRQAHPTDPPAPPPPRPPPL